MPDHASSQKETNMTTEPTTAAICAAYDAECIQRRPHWIGGEPLQCDLRAVRQAVSRKLGIPVLDVAEAIAGAQ
jgi:sulfatase maturation enzyme AslB (radical SAM superfamily)